MSAEHDERGGPSDAEPRVPVLADVAQIAGVSQQTVSRVVRGSPSVARRTRERVEAAIAEIGYRPNVAARTLVTRRSHRIGVVAANASLYGVSMTLTGIQEAARAAGREPSAIRRIYNIGGAGAPLVEAGASDDDQQIIGPRDHWVNVLSHLVLDHGFSTFVLWGVPTAPRLRMFIDEIAPAVKARVMEVRVNRA